MTLAVSSAGIDRQHGGNCETHSVRSSLFDPYSDEEEEEELEYGRGGRKESDDLMLQLDSIIPGVLEPLGTCLHLSLSI